ncbi:uncharacterized protein [Cardiocondyla obscurior]|uniref:uncharacterized protein n=1 Tax=Cardiocondyla obscurior TaxID=286306 RepID=UPI0039656A26
MNMDNEKEENLQLQGVRTPSSRQGRVASRFPLSLSNDGQSTSCSAGGVDDNVSAKTSSSKKTAKSKDTGRSLLSRSMGENLSERGTPSQRTTSPASSYLSGGTGDLGSDYGGSIEGDDERMNMPLGKRKRVIIGRKRTAEQRNDATSALERAAAMEEEESRILNANHPISARSQQRADKLEEDFLDDNRNAPSRDFASTVLRDMAVVLRVSGVSKGLKGEYSKALREIACRTRANVTTMLTRLNTDGSTGQETMSLLNELHKAQEEIKSLKQEVNTLRETIAQISPTQPPQSKKRREDPTPYKTTTGPISGTSKVVTSEVVSTKTTFKKPTNKAGGTLRHNEDREVSEISTNAISSVHFKYLDELFHSWCAGKSSGDPRPRNQPRSSQATTGTNKESFKSKLVTASEHPRSATAIAGTSKESPVVETWATVTGRKTKNSNKTVGQGNRTTSDKKAPVQPKPKTTKRKTPNSAAVSITCENGQYQEILKMAKDRIDLKKLGIDSLRPKRGITGSIIYEIKGDNHNEKAKVLAKELSTALASVQQVRIACPQKTADIRIRDLDDYTRKDDIINAVLTSFETCRQEDFKLGEIRRSYNGLYTTVLKCPVAVANQLIEKKRIQIGWVSARIEALPARPLQCFRCLQKGHVRENCNSPIDRSNSCFRCGETTHTAVTCKNLPKCLICEELKKPFRHKMGGPASLQGSDGSRNTGGTRSTKTCTRDWWPGGGHAHGRGT